jgi:hypothetical protein
MRIKRLFKKLSEKFRPPGKSTEPMPPSVLGSAVRVPYGAFKFKARVAKDSLYEVQATTNFREWSPILRDTSSEEIDFVDPAASKFSYRFYRLKVNGIYSRNIIGYVTVTLAPGFSMIANPLIGADNSVGQLFKGFPNGTMLAKYDSLVHRMTENSIKAEKWTNPGEKFVLGEGAIFFNPTFDYKPFSFVGDVSLQSALTPIPAGFSIRSYPGPQPGRLDTDLGFPIGDGDEIHIFDRDRQSYSLHTYSGKAWAPEAPIVGVGESFWVTKKTPGNWTSRPLRA